MFEIPTFGIPTFIIPIEKYSHNTNAPIIIPMPLSKYQCPIQNTHDARSKYQLKVRNTNNLKRVQFINSKYQQVGILNTVHNTNPSPQNNHLGACCCWAATSSRLAGQPDGPPDKYPHRPLQRLCSDQVAGLAVSRGRTPRRAMMLDQTLTSKKFLSWKL